MVAWASKFEGNALIVIELEPVQPFASVIVTEYVEEGAEGVTIIDTPVRLLLQRYV